MGSTYSGLVLKYVIEQASLKDNGTFASSLTERFAYRKGEARSVDCKDEVRPSSVAPFIAFKRVLCPNLLLV